MVRLVVAPAARRDLQLITDYITEEAGAGIAHRYVTSLAERFQHLARFPETGRSLPHLGTGIRRHPVHRHLIFYRYDQDRELVEIARVLHGSRNITQAHFKP